MPKYDNEQEDTSTDIYQLLEQLRQRKMAEESIPEDSNSALINRTPNSSKNELNLTDVPENLVHYDPDELPPNYGFPKELAKKLKEQTPQEKENWSEVPDYLDNENKGDFARPPFDVSNIINRKPDSLKQQISASQLEKLKKQAELEKYNLADIPSFVYKNSPIAELPPEYGFPKTNKRIKLLTPKK